MWKMVLNFKDYNTASTTSQNYITWKFAFQPLVVCFISLAYKKRTITKSNRWCDHTNTLSLPPFYTYSIMGPDTVYLAGIVPKAAHTHPPLILHICNDLLNIS